MSLDTLPKAYDPHEAQRRWYEFWLSKGYFHADPASPKPPYTIVIPPPNVTGALHLGHALNNTIQDILIRWKRMQGHDALWMPGTDHAGIATQAVVERRLFEEEKKTRHDLGREALVERIWAWKDEYEARILGQLRQMGCSCDWERTRFTLDALCSKAVRKTFFNLFKAGKIFRGKRLVNWDTHLRTAVADDEINYEDVKGSLWTIRYPVTGSTEEALLVATTRPETMLGDTAVAVHPEDERYRHLIGRTVTLPLLGRVVPIIADPILVDPKFGTGCVKVTPAHDPNDYQTGLRHELTMINLLNPDGTYNENAGPYAGLDRREVRKRVVADLEAQGLLARVEPYANRVGFSDRSKTPIEPYLSDQWFVRMGDEPDGSPGFAQQAMDAVTAGRVKVHPERYAKSYLDWLGEKRDWCISRQLWWGHRIPVWSRSSQLTSEGALKPLYHAYREHTRFEAWKKERHGMRGGDSDSALHSYWSERGAAYQINKLPEALVEHVCPSDLPPEAEAELIQELEAVGYVQDPDVLDTWFSSALWPHSTLGWPESTPELAKYYPTSVLSTARDIITLWVARMVIFGQFNVGDVPFHNVFIHPVIQDGDGKRMSKTAGNGIDPFDIIEAYGADALRYTLASAATETQDLRMPVEPLRDAKGNIGIRRRYGGPVEFVKPDDAKGLPKDQRVNMSERFEQGRTFPNKFWNAARFALMNLEGFEAASVADCDLAVEDRWALSRLRAAAESATADLEAFRFADLTKGLRDFTWDEFCDWYVEFAKGRLRDPAARPVAQRVLATVLDGACRLLHPIMPFVTESVWQALGDIAPRRGLPEPTLASESVCIAPWPSFPNAWHDGEAESEVGRWQAVITALRNLRAESNVPATAKIAPIVVVRGPSAEAIRRGGRHIESLTGASSLTIQETAERPSQAAIAVLNDIEVILPLEGLIDLDAERARQRKAMADLEKQRGALRAKLTNDAFVTRAPADVVEGLRAKEAELTARLAALDDHLNRLGGGTATEAPQPR